MNNLPYFQPHNPLHIELSSVRLNSIVLGQQASEIKPGFGIRTSRTPGGTTLSVIKKRVPSAVVLPFEITSATASSLKAAPGVINSDSHPETVKTFETTPSDGTWYLEAKVVINANTGDITSTAAQWVDTQSTTTTTNFFYTIGYVVIATVNNVQSFAITQSNYGPLYVLIHGTYDAKWGATIF
jgi:hypothetical protein